MARPLPPDDENEPRNFDELLAALAARLLREAQDGPTRRGRLLGDGTTEWLAED